jgi:hypothetical protein
MQQLVMLLPTTFVAKYKTFGTEGVVVNLAIVVDLE